MVGPNGFEPSTSSVSRKRSRPTELRAYTRTTALNSNGQRAFAAIREKPLYYSRRHQTRSRYCKLPVLAATIVYMKKGHAPSEDTRATTRTPFLPGCIVVVTLGNPRDKFWGMVLALAPEGLSMSGMELAGFEDFVQMVKDGEPFSPAVVFFPMHRIERIELDLPDGGLPSMAQRFSNKTGRDLAELLSSPVPKQQRGLSRASHAAKGTSGGESR
jgi:hypothetical protein